MSGPDEPAVTLLAPARPRRVDKGGVGRNAVFGTLNLGDPGSPVGPSPGGGVVGVALGPSGHALVGAVGPFRVANGTDDGKLVPELGEAWKELADFHARDVGRDGAELPAYLARCVRLEVEGIEVGRPAGKEDVDNGLVRTAHALLGLEVEQLSHGQATGGHSTELEEVAPRYPVAVRSVASVVSQKVQHGSCRSDSMHGTVLLKFFLVKTVILYPFFDPRLDQNGPLGIENPR